MPAAARKTDPHTSRLAADGVEASGVASDQRAVCLACVRRHSEGITAAEVARETGLERHAPSRRLPELRDAGLVTNGMPPRVRKCSVVGKRSMLWFPVSRQQALFA